MSGSLVKNIAACFILFTMLFPAWGQRSRTRLNKERQRIEKQIKLSHELLKETNYKQDKSLVELAVLNNQIKSRRLILICWS